jgi:hypothetical protein
VGAFGILSKTDVFDLSIHEMMKPLNSASATPGSSFSSSAFDLATAYLFADVKSTTAMMICCFTKSKTFCDSVVAS